ncbi:MAG: hypothetical protein ACPHUL_00185 [Marinomonas gallaica]
MSTKTLMINKNVHGKLKEISNKRKSEGHHAQSMAAIIAEMTLKQHKKEFK